VQPVLLNEKGQIIKSAGMGSLAMKDSWPGQMRGVYNDPERFFKTYFSKFKGYYSSEDGARRDKDGYYWITGRMDDIINISGHRVGTAEVEAAINTHPQVAESAVIGIPHPIKGEGLFAFVILKSGEDVLYVFKDEVLQTIGKNIGSFAKPEHIVIVPGLPKTRSGKIMRRLLRKIATGKTSEIGDVSTLADPRIVDKISEIVTKALKEKA
jgi:acetyl-CoA synthetase